MAAKKRLQPTEAFYGGDPKRKGPEFDTCNYLIEAIGPEFDHNRVLLQRAFFINKKIPDTFPSDSIRLETTNPW
jgi:hypothetical protein